MNWTKTKWVAFGFIGLLGLLVQFYIKTASQPMPKTTAYSEVIQWANEMNLPIQTQGDKTWDKD